MPHHNPYKTIDDITAELILLTAQVDAHRFVLAWLLKQMPNDDGRRFLATQANIFDTKDNDTYADQMIAELDSLRSLLAVLDDGDPSE